MDSREKNHLFRKGLEAFNAARFFDAHEEWECVWLETPNPEKAFLQGLIQVAAAFHHYSRANRQGTQQLLRAGMIKLERFPGVHRGIELEPLLDDVRRWLKALDAGENPQQHGVPHIKCRENHEDL
jgi:predicted metal-dependent hydrolase